MKNYRYEKADAVALLPLLRSITREIQERTLKLSGLEQLLDQVARGGRPASEEAELVARTALQRREIRHAREELESLGCSIVGTEPITVRIPGHLGPEKRSFMYQTGDAALK